MLDPRLDSSNSHVQFPAKRPYVVTGWCYPTLSLEIDCFDKIVHIGRILVSKLFRRQLKSKIRAHKNTFRDPILQLTAQSWWYPKCYLLCRRLSCLQPAMGSLRKLKGLYRRSKLSAKDNLAVAKHLVSYTDIASDSIPSQSPTYTLY